MTSGCGHCPGLLFFSLCRFFIFARTYTPDDIPDAIEAKFG